MSATAFPTFGGTHTALFGTAMASRMSKKSLKKTAERLATDARPLAACEGKTRDLNWTAKNHRSELAAALRLSPTQSQTGPTCCLPPQATGRLPTRGPPTATQHKDVVVAWPPTWVH